LKQTKGIEEINAELVKARIIDDQARKKWQEIERKCLVNSEYRQQVKKICDISFEYFVRLFFFCSYRMPFVYIYEIHKPIIDAYESLVLADLEYKTRKTNPLFKQMCKNSLDKRQVEIGKNLMVNMLPRCGKSQLTILFIAWTFAREHNLEYMYVAADRTLVQDFGEKAKGVVKTEIYQKMFNITVSNQVDSKEYWEIKKDGYNTRGKVRTFGFLGQATGHGAGSLDNTYANGEFKFTGAIIIDDPISGKHAESATIKENALQIYNQVFSTRKNSSIVPIILTAQRLASDDLCGQILEEHASDWDVVKVKGLLGTDDTNKLDKVRSIWEARYSTASLLRRKRISPSTFYAQYQQEPLEGVGEIFDVNDFQYYNYDKAPEWDEYSYIFMTADTARTVKQSSDYTVIGLWGSRVSAVGTSLFLIDILRGKWEKDIVNNIGYIHDIYYEKVQKNIPLYLEKEGFNQGLNLDDALSRYASKLGVYINILHPDRKQNASKVGRAMAVNHFIRDGRLLFPRDKTFIHYNASWEKMKQAIVYEFAHFKTDDSHAHDDIIDVCVDAISIALNTNRENKEISSNYLQYGIKNITNNGSHTIRRLSNLIHGR